MSNDTENAVQGDVNDIDFGADANVGGNRYPFLGMGPEGGAGCTYVLEYVNGRYWRQPPKGGNKNKLGPKRFSFTVRVKSADGDGASAVGSLNTILFLEDDFGYYMKDTKNLVKAATGAEFDKDMAGILFDNKNGEYGKFDGALFGAQVTRNVKNSQFPVYTFEGPITPEAGETAE